MAALSIKNVNTHAPWWWQRIETSFLMFFIPGFTIFIVALPMHSDKKVWFTAAGSLLPFILRGIGVLLGDQVKAEKNEDVAQMEDEPPPQGGNSPNNKPPIP